MPDKTAFELMNEAIEESSKNIHRAFRQISESINSSDAGSSHLVRPAIPPKFAQEMFVINALELLGEWLVANKAPVNVLCLYAALDWAVDYSITASGNDGLVYPHQDPDRVDFTVWLSAIYQLADSLGYSLDVA